MNFHKYQLIAIICVTLATISNVRADAGAIKSGVGKCLDVHAPDQHLNGAKVQVWDCNNTIQQIWKVEGRAIKSGFGKCLDVHAPDQHLNGAKVQVWDCNNSIQQTWTIEGRAIKSGVGKCLDVHAPDQRLNGAKVQVWDCNNTVQQTWTPGQHDLVFDTRIERHQLGAFVHMSGKGFTPGGEVRFTVEDLAGAVGPKSLGIFAIIKADGTFSDLVWDGRTWPAGGTAKLRAINKASGHSITAPIPALH